MSDTMLRLGVPPHIGQSPVGCAETATTIVETIANALATNDVCRIVFLFPVGPLACSPVGLLIPVNLHVIEIDVRDAVGIDAGAPHDVRDLVHLLDCPCCRFGAVGGPYLAAHPRHA